MTLNEIKISLLLEYFALLLVPSHFPWPATDSAVSLFDFKLIWGPPISKRSCSSLDVDLIPSGRCIRNGGAGTFISFGGATADENSLVSLAERLPKVWKCHLTCCPDFLCMF